MENLNSVFSRPMPTPASLLEMAPITERQQAHLGKVYSHLAMGIVMTALGAYVDAKVFGIPPIVSGIVCMLLAMSILSSRENKIDQGRLGKFFAFAFFKGMSIGAFMFQIVRIHPHILPTAFCATLAVFACFSGVAIFAKQRSYLYLGSMLGSALMYMSFLSIFNMFFGFQMAFDVVLYGTLAVFLGYVIFDTQVILEQEKQGDQDVLRHALQLYIDVVAIFIRIVVILLKREEDKNRRKRRD